MALRNEPLSRRQPPRSRVELIEEHVILPDAHLKFTAKGYIFPSIILTVDGEP
jgi:hypothetical protein